MLCDDRVSNDSNSKENLKSPSRINALTKTEVASTSESTTSFNPFGKFKPILESNKTLLNDAVNNLIASFESESGENAKHFLKRRPEATQVVIELKKMATTIKSMAKTNGTSVTSALTILIPSLSKLADQFSKQLTNSRSGDVLQISETISESLNAISLLCQPPFSSDLLEDWSVLFESFLKSNVAVLRKSAINLWRSTFSKCPGKIKYPNDRLRNLLVSAPSKIPINIPEAEEKLENSSNEFVDEEAMDGIEVFSPKKTDFAEPQNPKPPAAQESLSSFELSQQPNVDNLAQKLISEKSSTTPINTPENARKKKKAAEKLLIDEDSCDFVVIKTPVSAKKNKLTDHQMEKFEESRDGINYVNEESQSGTQKAAALKNALTTFNFDVPTPVEPETLPEDNTTRKPAKRQRRSLFTKDEDDKKAEPRKTRSKKIKLQENETKKEVTAEKETPNVDECLVDTNPETLDGDDEKESLPVMQIPTPVKKQEEAPVLSEETSSSETSDEKDEQRQTKRKSRTPKKIAEKIILRRKSSRNVKTIEDPVEDQKKKPEAEKDYDETVEKEDGQKEEEKEEEVKKTPSKSEQAEVPIVSTPIHRKVAPTAVSTPSILRKTPVSGTPLTEKKKNRVHFDAEPVEERKSAASSPKRMPPPTPFPVSNSTSSKDSSLSPISVEKSTSSSALFDLELESTAIYPPLKDCDDPADVLVRLLVPFSGVVTAMSILRKSFSTAGIKTVGQLSQMTKSQISKMVGIRVPRDKTTKKVLAEYDANSKKLVKYASFSKIEESPKKEVPVEKSVEEVVTKVVAQPEEVVEEVVVEPEEVVAKPPEEVKVDPVEPVGVVVETATGLLTPEKKTEEKEEAEKIEEKEEVIEKSPEKIVEQKEVDANLLQDCEKLDNLVRSISRKMGRGQYSTDELPHVDDKLYNSFLVLRGMVKERGFNNV